MKSINITEVFCEILSGLALISLSIPLIDILGIKSLPELLPVLLSFVNLGIVTILVIVS